jgi:superfamily II DNA or RNA helicase
MLNLWPFQIEANRELWREYQRGTDSVLLQMATGGGKTMCASHMIQMRHQHLREKTLFLAHRRELVHQSARKLEQAGMNPEIIMAGCAPNPWANVMVGSVQTLLARRSWNGLPEAKFLVVDEAHISMAKGYLSIIKHYLERGAKLLGLTATPMRQDGKGLASVYRKMVCGPSVPWLMEQGYLVPRIEYRVGIAPDVKGVKIVGGEYNQAQLEAASDQGILIGDIVENWLTHSKGMRTLCFAAGVKHSIHIVERFREAGISAEHVDGDTPKDERERIYERSESGEVMVVSNAQVYIEGTDFPWMECLIDAQKNAGLVRYLQKGGRLMRAHPGKEFARYMDHAGNVHRHGRLELAREWMLTQGKEQVESLEAQRKQKDKVQVQCPVCGFLLTSAICSHCGHRWKTEGEARDVIPATLVEMTWDELEQKTNKTKREYTTEEKQAWYSGLLWLARERGNKDGLAWHQFREKFGHYPAGYAKTPKPPSFEVESWDRHRRIRWAKAKKKEEASA